jgi:hypothetical protein
MSETPLGKTTKLSGAPRCPACHAKIAAATHATEKISPKPGDLSICLYCKTVLVFDEAVQPRRATAAEIQMFREHPDVAPVLENLDNPADFTRRVWNRRKIN